MQGFQKSLQEYKLPDSMIAVGSVPHVLDQKGQSDMLLKLGVASDEIDGHKVTEDKIISCIKDMEYITMKDIRR